MLFYNQIKREFSNTSWREGQLSFRQERVQKVRLLESAVVAQITEGDDLIFESRVNMVRGRIASTTCSCDLPKSPAMHCKHVAALCIWVIERGSLLRAGIGGTDDGIDEVEFEPSKKIVREPKKIYVRAEPVALVKGIFLNKKLTALSVDVAVRYPGSGDQEGTVQIEPMKFLTRESEPRCWRTSGGVSVKIVDEFVPVLETLEAARIVYHEHEALDYLAKFLTHPYRHRIVFHTTVDLEYEQESLKLVSLHIGRKIEKTRHVTYEFRNANLSITSEELDQLNALGRVNNRFVWHGSKLYRFDTPLSELARYINRTGSLMEDSDKQISQNLVGGYLADDEGPNPLHPLAAFRLSLELGVEKFTVDPEWKEFHEWRKNFDKRRIPQLPSVDYGFDLRDYQLNGLSWLWSLEHRGLAALLADDMGLGKTHQVLAMLTSLYRSRNAPKAPSLVVAPTSVVVAWSQKLQKYPTGLQWKVFHGKERTLPTSGLQLVLTTYGILQKEAILREKEWHVVILDEAQAIKNASTISFRASRILKSKFRIAMTGTPVENQSADLWSIMEFLLPGYLGTLPRFKRLYGSGREVPTPMQANGLKRLVAPFLLRRTKTQVLKELPEKTEEVIQCEMTSTQDKVYRDFLASTEAARVRENLQNGTKIDYASVLALLTRLKQVCDHPRLPDVTSGKIKRIAKVDPFESGKWETFQELIDEAMRSNLKVVVFTQYLGMIDVMGHALKEKGIGYVELRGDTQDRAQRLTRFSNDPECKVFLCSLLAGGLGIDLTAASVCIHYDRWWNPAKENQATDRLHRIGQTRGVQVFKLQIPGTIEERIANIIASKVVLSGTLVEESSLGLKAFSRRELLDLLTSG